MDGRDRLLAMLTDAEVKLCRALGPMRDMARRGSIARERYDPATIASEWFEVPSTTDPANLARLASRSTKERARAKERARRKRANKVPTRNAA